MGNEAVPVDVNRISFLKREFKGSRLRCLLATSLGRRAVAQFLTELVQPHAQVAVSDRSMPAGLLSKAEARLDEADVLPVELRKQLSEWWLAVPERANTPNWDLVSTCSVDGRPGIILVEAKAHSGELHEGGLGAGNTKNAERITAAIAEANGGLGGSDAGWHLAANSHYQLAKRFAWSWKLASLGLPVVVVYLGFLDAHEMERGVLHSDAEWRTCVLDHANHVVPADAWDKPHAVDDASFVAVIRSASVVASVTV